MIIAEKKNIDEIYEVVSNFNNIMILGCGTCTTVCMAGGAKQVEELSSQLEILAKNEQKSLKIIKETIERQCDREFFEDIVERAKGCEAVISMGCGIGVQLLSEYLETIPVYPALNTRFIGSNEAGGVWLERCKLCGDCILGKTGGICPITRCSKSLLNGPCGGTQDGKCEVDSERDCAWVLIYNRLKSINRLEDIEKIFEPAKNSIKIYPLKQESKNNQTKSS